MKVVITGANYNNKGAQSMLFVTVDEISKRFPGSEIYFTTSENVDDSNLKFRSLYISDQARNIAMGGFRGCIQSIKVFIKDCAKTVLKRGSNPWKSHDLKNVLKTSDLIIDVSGFALGEQWDATVQKRYLFNINLAKRYNIPIYLMPQSFGPFDYDSDKVYLLNEIRASLKYPNIIFARETEGYEMLKKEFGLKNVRVSSDLVLQNIGVDEDRIFKSRLEWEIPALNTLKDDSVAILPNMQCFLHGEPEKIMSLYENLVNVLLAAGKTVYLFRHAGDDNEICMMIKNLFINNEKVVFLDKDLSCLEYDKFIVKFQFIICSRFHGIVHAYRNGIPCIILGWAIKYEELAHNVCQDKYVFNITDQEFDRDQLMRALNDMLINSENESTVIKKSVAEIQGENCFDIVEKDFQSRYLAG